MDLTPIKVKGKRKGGNQATQPRHKIHRPAGSGSSTRTSSKSSSVATKTKSKSSKSRRKVSLLEELPTEILQRIFLFCINLELPRTSFILRDKLSSEIVYLRTVYEGFGPSWSDVRLQVWPKEDCLSYNTRKGNHVLQSAILRCRWATLDILRKAEAAFFKHMYQNNIGDWIDWNGPNDSLQRGKESTFANSSLNELSSIREKGFEDDYQHFLALNDYIIQASEGIGEDFSWRHTFYLTNEVKHRSTLLSHNLTAIPTSLLNGPWTEDMITHLFWILRTVGVSGRASATRLIEQKPVDLEAAQQGIEEAVNSFNLSALRILTTYVGLNDELDVKLFKRAAMLEAPENHGITAHLINLINIIPFGEERESRQSWADTAHRRELEKLQAMAKKRPIRDPERQPLIDWYDKMLQYGEDIELMEERIPPGEDTHLPSLFEGGPDLIRST